MNIIKIGEGYSKDSFENSIKMLLTKSNFNITKDIKIIFIIDNDNKLQKQIAVNENVKKYYFNVLELINVRIIKVLSNNNDKVNQDLKKFNAIKYEGGYGSDEIPRKLIKKAIEDAGIKMDKNKEKEEEDFDYCCKMIYEYTEFYPLDLDMILKHFQKYKKTRFQ